MRGLIGRRGLLAGEGVLLRPAPAIHSAFVRFPIDAVFLDGQMRVLDIAARLRPWRVASKRGAQAVLELAAGECARRGVAVGHQLALRDRRPVPVEATMPGVGTPSPTRSSSRSVIWQTQTVGGADAVRHRPLRVMVVSCDHHFRSVTAMLLVHRDCAVTTTANAGRVVELAVRDSVDAVVLDAEQSPDEGEATVAALGGLARPVGVVVVSEIGPFRGQRATVVPKWGPFEDLFMAIERADEARGSRRGGQ